MTIEPSEGARGLMVDDPQKARVAGEDRHRVQTARLLLECNFRCPFCFAAWHEEESPPPQEVMNLTGQNWKNYIDGTRKAGYERLCISGGEPTMHPDILKIVRYAREVGFKLVELQTNASLMTEKNARRLVKAGVTDALVSLHSHVPETFDRITVTEGVFDTVIEGIRHLTGLGIHVMLSHVIIKWNVADLVEYVRFVKREVPDVTEILFFSMQPESRAADNLHLWPKLPDVRKHLPAALEEAARLGVRFRMDSQEGFPMCQVKGHEHRVDLHDIVDPHATFGDDLNAFHVIARKKVKLPTCQDCFFEPACYGFWEGYFLLNGPEGIEATPRTDRLGALFPNLDAAWQEKNGGPAQTSPQADLVPVRPEGAATQLDEDTLATLPLPWREGRPKAQKIR